MKFNKYHAITRIIEKTSSLSGINFQRAIGEILKIYYGELGKGYEMPSHYGGDDKNDGWVVDDALFYQIYGPRDIKESFKRDIRDKFSEDLEGLVKLIVDDKKWKGFINEFIFIVNTRDDNLPADSDRFFEKKTEEINEKYHTSLSSKVVNLDYIRDILEEDINNQHTFVKILSRLNIMSGDISNITEGDIAGLIDKISATIIEQRLQNNDGSSSTYERISTPEKIKINKLEELQDEIEKYLNNLNIVDSCFVSLTDDVNNSLNIEVVTKYIIKLYNELVKTYEGVTLLEQIFKEIFEMCHQNESEIMPIKLLIIYIFDKCDIFEHE